MTNKLTNDETAGWIFSDEYHAWQDQQRAGAYRPGRMTVLWERYGAAVGLFSIKRQEHNEINPILGVSARWPEPFERQTIDDG